MLEYNKRRSRRLRRSLFDIVRYSEVMNISTVQPNSFAIVVNGSIVPGTKRLQGSAYSLDITE